MKQVQCFLVVKTILILFILLSFRLSAQVITIPANISYYTLNEKPIRVIKCASTIEFDSLESELRVASYMQKRVEFFSVTVNNQRLWVQAKVIRKIYIETYGNGNPQTLDHNYDSHSTYESTATQCTGTTKKGRRCLRMTKNSSGRCWQHE